MVYLIADNVADLWLILAPAYILFQMKLRSVHRRLILSIFTCGIFTILASITHSVFILIRSPNWVGISGEIQVRNLSHPSRCGLPAAVSQRQCGINVIMCLCFVHLGHHRDLSLEPPRDSYGSLSSIAQARAGGERDECGEQQR